MLTIGAFARLAGIRAKQLRAYDASGVFKPAWVDPSSAYRRYSPAQLPELRRILALRRLGMSLADIKALAADDELRTALDRRRAELERERRLVEERLAALEISVSDVGGLDVVVRPVAPEPVALLTLESAAERGFVEVEEYVRDHAVRAHRPPGAIPDERLIFVPVRAPFPASARIGFRTLSASRMATVLSRGPYAGLADARRTLRRWVDTTGLTVSGPERVLYLAFGAEPGLGIPEGWVVERDEDLLTEIQLPIA